MHRTPFSVTLAVLALAIPFALANYEPAFIPSPWTCTGTDSNIQAHQLSVTVELSGTEGRQLSQIKMRVGINSAEVGTSAKMVVGITNDQPPTGAVGFGPTGGRWAESFWTTSAEGPFIILSAFDIIHTTGGSDMGNRADMTIDFINETITLANNTGGYSTSRHSWRNPDAVIPAGTHHFGIDIADDGGGWQLNQSSNALMDVRGNTLCTGDPELFVGGNPGGSLGGSRYLSPPWMVFWRPPPPPVNPPTNLDTRPGSVAQTVELSWTAPLDGAVSYSIYRDGALAGTSLTTAFTDTASTYTLFCYRVAGSNGGEDGPLSNQDCSYPKADSLLSPTGPLYGGDKAEFAQSVGVSESAVDFIYAALLILALVAAGFAFGRVLGALLAAFVGVVAGYAIGWLPLWAVILIAATGIGVSIMFLRRD